MQVKQNKPFIRNETWISFICQLDLESGLGLLLQVPIDTKTFIWCYRTRVCLSWSNSLYLRLLRVFLHSKTFILPLCSTSATFCLYNTREMIFTAVLSHKIYRISTGIKPSRNQATEIYKYSTTYTIAKEENCPCKSLPDLSVYGFVANQQWRCTSPRVCSPRLEAIGFKKKTMYPRPLGTNSQSMKIYQKADNKKFATVLHIEWNAFSWWCLTVSVNRV